MSDVVTRVEKNRVMGITTPLGEDKLLVVEMRGTERMGRLFEFELDLIAEENAVDFTKILGQNVTVRLDLKDQSKRYFNGYISRFTFIALEEGRADSKKIYHYRATMVPQLWFLTRTANCRIFQEKTVPDIIKKVCQGFTMQFQLSGKYRQWDYCVQYRETDFNFVSRLMENEGIYYYFTHEDGKHTMVLTDAPSSHMAATGYDSLHFDEPDLKSTHDAFIWEWIFGHEVTTTKYVLKDYNMTTPKTDLMRSQNVNHSHDPDKYEVFDYPGAYPVGDDGVNYSNIRLEELEADYAVVHAITSARGVHVGAIFTLEDHPEFEEEEYLITGATYAMRNDDLGLGGRQRTGVPIFRAQVTCIPKKYEFRTPRTTPKPFMQGPQTAVIVGPAGEEIYTDKYSRVKVQFHWDREGRKDEHSSCWIRVSQPVAGKKYGDVNIPRIGHEVIVDFLEGDPDQPIITGRVYNDDNMPPYTLPGQKMVRGSKTNSTPGGGGSNEMSMDDTKGKEKITIHAQYDMTTTVEHDDTQTVHNNREITVDGTHTETIDKDTKIKIKTGIFDHDVATGTAHYHVTADVTEDFDATQTTTVANDILITSKNTFVHIEAKTEIQLHVGDSKLLLKTDGSIELSGKNIAITGSESVTISGKSITSKADADHNISGNIVVSDGSATNTVKGGMVMLNP